MGQGQDTSEPSFVVRFLLPHWPHKLINLSFYYYAATVTLLYPASLYDKKIQQRIDSTRSILSVKISII